MAGGYSHSLLKFVKLSGEEIPYQAPPSSTVRDVAPALAKFFPGGSVRLIDESGNLLYSHDRLPPEGVLQVQVMGIAPGKWCDIFFSALAGFEEEPLRRQLEAAWKSDFVSRVPEGSHPHAFEGELTDWQNAQVEAFQKVVVKCCGQWADYWTFAQMGDTYGYPYVRPPYATKAPSVDLVVTDVKRWQKLLLDLEDEFAHLRSRCAGYDLCEHLETAIAALLRYCPSFATNAEWQVGFETWYVPFAELVSWYLGSAGLEDEHINLLENVTNAIHGFDSYRCPPSTAATVVEQVSRTYKQKFEKVDSTAEWLAVRLRLVACTPRKVETTGQDSHLHFTDQVDGRRDAQRAANLRYALDQCRKDAKSGAPLAFEHLVKWQQFLLPTTYFAPDRAFRVHDAYAKRGRERYPIDGTTESKFKELLSQANSDEPLSLRAVRAFLDVCFFHPFNDCNSRMARLVFDFLLTREGYTLTHVDPIFMFAKSARDAEGAQNMVQQVEQLLVKCQADWEKPLEEWIKQNPHPGLVTLDKLDNHHNKWFGCQTYPDDNQDFLRK